MTIREEHDEALRLARFHRKECRELAIEWWEGATESERRRAPKWLKELVGEEK